MSYSSSSQRPHTAGGYGQRRAENDRYASPVRSRLAPKEPDPIGDYNFLLQFLQFTIRNFNFFG